MLLDHALNIVTMIAWVVLAIFVLLTLLRTTLVSGFGAALRKLFGGALLYVILLFVIAIALLNSSLVFVEPQQGAIVISLLDPDGYRSHPLRSGLHWITPVLEEVVIYPVSMQTYTMSASPLEGEKRGDDSIMARTSDGQEVSIDCSVIFQIDPDQMVLIHINWQDRYVSEFIRPSVRGIIRNYVSQYTVDEVNSSKRLDMAKGLEDETRILFADQGILLNHFVLRNIAFTPEYAASVEEKQIALQHVSQRKYEGEAIKIKAQAEADAVRIKAMADADALKLLGESLKLNPDVITLRYVDKLSPGIQVMLVPNNAPYLLPLPSLAPATPLAPIATTSVATPTLEPTATATATPAP